MIELGFPASYSNSPPAPFIPIGEAVARVVARAADEAARRHVESNAERITR